MITRKLKLPHIHVLPHEHPGTVVLESAGFAIHGQSFARAAVTDNLVLRYPEPLAGWINIGLLHTGLTGLEGHERYAPCTIEDLRARGYDYWALGHVHRHKVLQEDPYIVFSGNLQGRHTRETGPKGAVKVTVAGVKPVIRVSKQLFC